MNTRKRPLLNVQSDLKLSQLTLSESSITPSDISGEEHDLRDQLSLIKNENEILQQRLLDREIDLEGCHSTIGDLNEKIKEYECLCNNEYMTASQLANCKIVELTKKLREKTSETEKYKTKSSKLERNFLEIKEKYENVEQPCKEEKCSDPDEMKKLQDKLSQVSGKWVEEKNASTKLKNDLKLANKWLQQEIGDKFETLVTLNNGTSNWRGRAQIIQDLQQKNNDLKEKLKKLQENNPEANVPTSNRSSLDKKLEALTSENAEIKNNFEELKRKYDASKARGRVLETECGLLKTKLRHMDEANEHSQRIIETLTAQVSGRNDRKNEDMRQKEQFIKKLQQENELLKIEVEKEKCASENKTKQLEEKSSNIDVLNKRIRSARPPSSYMRRHETENPEAKNINRLEVERLRLLELTELQNKRLEEERNEHLKTQNTLTQEKQKVAKLEANVARMGLEQNCLRSGYSSRTSLPTKLSNEPSLKDKLEIAEEQIKALTTRLEIETFERKKDIKEFTKILKNYDCK